MCASVSPCDWWRAFSWLTSVWFTIASLVFIENKDLLPKAGKFIKSIEQWANGAEKGARLNKRNLKSLMRGHREEGEAKCSSDGSIISGEESNQEMAPFQSSNGQELPGELRASSDGVASVGVDVTSPEINKRSPDGKLIGSVTSAGVDATSPTIKKRSPDGIYISNGNNGKFKDDVNESATAANCKDPIADKCTATSDIGKLGNTDAPLYQQGAKNRKEPSLCSAHNEALDMARILPPIGGCSPSPDGSAETNHSRVQAASRGLDQSASATESTRNVTHAAGKLEVDCGETQCLPTQEVTYNPSNATVATAHTAAEPSMQLPTGTNTFSLRAMIISIIKEQMATNGLTPGDIDSIEINLKVSEETEPEPLDIMGKLAERLLIEPNSTSDMKAPARSCIQDGQACTPPASPCTTSFPRAPKVLTKPKSLLLKQSMCKYSGQTAGASERKVHKAKANVADQEKANFQGDFNSRGECHHEQGDNLINILSELAEERQGEDATEESTSDATGKKVSDFMAGASNGEINRNTLLDLVLVKRPEAATVIQSAVRSYGCKAKYTMMRTRSVIRLQCFLRRRNSRCALRLLRTQQNVAVLLQSYVRRIRRQSWYIAVCKGAIVLQCLCRRQMAHAAVRRVRSKHTAVIMLQSKVRAMCCQHTYRCARNSIVRWQYLARRRISRQRWCVQRRAALKVQSCVRRSQCTARYGAARIGIVNIQCIARRRISQTNAKRLRSLRLAVVAVQTLVRQVLCQRQFVSKTCFVVGLQSKVRRVRCQAAYRLARNNIVNLQGLIRCQIALQQLRVRTAAATVVQSLMRSARHHQQFGKLKTHVVVLQRVIRRVSCQVKYHLTQNNSVKIQSLVRLRIASITASKLFSSRNEKAAKKLQSLARGAKCRQKFTKLHLCAAMLQSAIRRHKCKTKYVDIQSNIVSLQCLVRRRFACQIVSQMQILSSRKTKAAVTIQTIARGCNCRRTWAKIVAHSVLLQSIARRRLCQEKYKMILTSISALQFLVRRRISMSQSENKKRRMAAVPLQSLVRGAKRQRQYVILKAVTVTLQSMVRRVHCETKHRECRAAIVRLQRCFCRRRQQNSRSRKKTSLKSQRLSAIMLESHWRPVKFQRRFATLRASTVLLQSVMRRYHCQRNYEEVRVNIVIVQGLVRRRTCQNKVSLHKLNKQEMAAVTLQSLVRGVKCRKQRTHMKCGAIKLQSVARRMLCRSQYKGRRSSSVTLQCLARCGKAQTALRMLKGKTSTAVRIQGLIRVAKCQKDFARTRACILVIQSAVRRSQCQLAYKKAQTAAIRLECFARRRTSEQQWKSQQAAAVTFQSLVRGGTHRQRFAATKDGCVRLQAAVRCHLTRHALQTIQVASVMMQSSMRRALCRKKYSVVLRRLQDGKSSSAVPKDEKEVTTTTIEEAKADGLSCWAPSPGKRRKLADAPGEVDESSSSMPSARNGKGALAGALDNGDEHTRGWYQGEAEFIKPRPTADAASNACKRGNNVNLYANGGMVASMSNGVKKTSYSVHSLHYITRDDTTLRWYQDEEGFVNTIPGVDNSASTMLPRSSSTASGKNNKEGSIIGTSDSVPLTPIYRRANDDAAQTIEGRLLFSDIQTIERVDIRSWCSCVSHGLSIDDAAAILADIAIAPSTLRPRRRVKAAASKPGALKSVPPLLRKRTFGETFSDDGRESPSFERSPSEWHGLQERCSRTAADKQLASRASSWNDFASSMGSGIDGADSPLPIPALKMPNLFSSPQPSRRPKRTKSPDLEGSQRSKRMREGARNWSECVVGSHDDDSSTRMTRAGASYETSARPSPRNRTSTVSHPSSAARKQKMFHPSQWQSRSQKLSSSLMGAESFTKKKNTNNNTKSSDVRSLVRDQHRQLELCQQKRQSSSGRSTNHHNTSKSVRSLIQDQHRKSLACMDPGASKKAITGSSNSHQIHGASHNALQRQQGEPTSSAMVNYSSSSGPKRFFCEDDTSNDDSDEGNGEDESQNGDDSSTSTDDEDEGAEDPQTLSGVLARVGNNRSNDQRGFLHTIMGMFGLK
jgi:hypothetical protein